MNSTTVRKSSASKRSRKPSTVIASLNLDLDQQIQLRKSGGRYWLKFPGLNPKALSNREAIRTLLEFLSAGECDILNVNALYSAV